MENFFRRKMIGLVVTALMIQGVSRGELELSDKQMGRVIHSAIVEDNTLPYCAHVVRVRAKGGKVTLVGRVHTEDQKEKIGEKAADIVGDENVTNDIVIVGPK